MAEEKILENVELESDLAQDEKLDLDSVDVSQVLAENEKLKKELEVQKDLFLRVAAEYDNYRKRTERDKALIYNDATANAIENMLSVADSLEMAAK